MTPTAKVSSIIEIEVVLFSITESNEVCAHLKYRREELPRSMPNKPTRRFKLWEEQLSSLSGEGSLRDGRQFTLTSLAVGLHLNYTCQTMSVASRLCVDPEVRSHRCMIHY